MLLGLSGFYGWLAGVEIAAIAATLVFVAWRRNDVASELRRRDVLAFGVVWVIGLTAFYWIAGPYSYIQINDEGELSVPLLIQRLQHHLGGLYNHGIAGGSDILAATAYNNGVLSLESAFFAIFPPWAALGLHKILAGSLSFGGAYFLARHGTGADRGTALAIAAFYSLAHRYMLGATVFQGLAAQLLPLAIYLIVCRAGRPRYWPAVVAIAVVQAISTAPFHIFPAVVFGIVLGWAFFGFVAPRRVLGAIGLIVILTLANWADVIYALLQTSSEMSLVRRVMASDATSFFANLAKYPMARSPETFVLAAATLVWLAIRRDRRVFAAAAILVSAWVSGPILLAVPWGDIGLKILRGYDFFYISLALPAVLILAAGWAQQAYSREAIRSEGSRWRSPRALFLAFAVGQALYHLTFSAVQWVAFGGQANLWAHANLASREWAPRHPFRVVTIPYRLDPNTVATYGLESFDGFVTSHIADRSAYWRLGVCGNRPGCPWLLQTYVSHHSVSDFQCCRVYDAARIFYDLDALRAANVEFIISTLPIEGTGIEYVSGPGESVFPPRAGDPLLQRVVKSLAWLADSPGVHVYRLSGALPRAFIAGRVIGSDAAVDDPGRVAQAVQVAMARDAVVGSDQKPLLVEPRTGEIMNIETVRDGYRVAVRMPQGGVLVVNAPWTTHWEATADGRRVASVGANMIHTAIAVPPGTSTVDLRYRRPTLFRYY